MFLKVPFLLFHHMSDIIVQKLLLYIIFDQIHVFILFINFILFIWKPTASHKVCVVVNPPPRIMRRPLWYTIEAVQKKFESTIWIVHDKH